MLITLIVIFNKLIDVSSMDLKIYAYLFMIKIFKLQLILFIQKNI